MNPEMKPYPVVDKLINIFGNWLKARRDINELRDFDSGEFARIAQELGVSPSSLDTFVRQGPHAADELPHLLTALGIDREALSRTQPLVLRDMEQVCSLCQHKHQCDRDLLAGTAAHSYEEYCGNAGTIDNLQLTPH